jgi:uncharacterized Ntn-hydrolase superfamily protein
VTGERPPESLAKERKMAVHYDPILHTFSIVARDSESGQLGVAVQTHQMCVGSIVPWLMAGVGAVATQATANVSYGPIGLAMLREGLAAPQVVEALVASDPRAHSRQVAVVDAQGGVAAWTGKDCIAEAAHHVGQGYSVQANMMEKDSVVPAMVEAYEQATGDLAARMMAALHAAQRKGGDIRGMQSAALKIVSGDPGTASYGRTIYDLRVDEHQDPLAELARLARLRSAQLLDAQGHGELRDKNVEQALKTWAQARAKAPELEEMGFWQAVRLADGGADATRAAEILNQVLASDERREQWIDLIRRIQNCGMIERPGAGDELIATLS